MLKAKSSKNFQSPKICKILTFKGPWRSGGMTSSDFYCKNTSLRESTSFEPFCVKIGWGVWPPGVSRKKVRKSRTPLMMCRR